MSLAGFRSVEVPDVDCIKMVYSDFRSVTSVVNQGEYVYRLNSVFDPDFTGVGGQPDGFDQWKTLYNQYRVVASDIEVQAVGFTGMGFYAIAATNASTSITSAEEAAGLRHAKGAVFTLGQGFVPKLKMRVHVGDIIGCSDEAILADNDYAGPITGSPNRPIFLHVCQETAGASDVVYFWTKITYYVRMESALSLIDTMRRHGTMARLTFAATSQRLTVPDRLQPKSEREQTTKTQAGAPTSTAPPPRLSSELGPVAQALASASVCYK